MRWIVLLSLVACGGDDGGSGNPNKDAAPTSDGRMQDSSMMQIDAAIGPGAVCGAMTCMTTQVCCTGANLVCTTVANCPTQSFACDGPEDCTGATCCYGNGGQGGSTCKASCAEPACHVDTDCPTATPKCCPKMFTPNYGVCKTAC